MSKSAGLFLVAALLPAGALGGFWLLRDTAEVPEDASHGIVPLRRGPIAAVVSATGTLTPVNTVEVGSQVSGILQGTKLAAAGRRAHASRSGGRGRSGLPARTDGRA